MKTLVTAAAAAFAAVAFAAGAGDGRTRAQEPIAPPSDIMVVWAPGGERLQWRDHSTDEIGYRVEMRVSSPDRSEGGRFPLGDAPADVASIELPDGDSSLDGGRCYAVEFTVETLGPPGSVRPGAHSQPHTLCTGTGGSFESWQTPSFGFIEQTPAPVANLRIFRDERNYWNLTWEASPGAARYDAGIQVLDADGMLLGQAAFPSVSGVTSVRIDRVATEFVGLGCFTAVARVFAVGVDGSVTLPASVTTPVCIGLYGLTFPETGVGGGGGDGGVWFAIVAAIAIGLGSIAFGFAVWRRV